jgi:hypothetical protein
MKYDIRWKDRPLDELIYDVEFNAEIEVLTRLPNEIPPKMLYRVVENGNMLYEWCNLHHGFG